MTDERYIFTPQESTEDLKRWAEDLEREIPDIVRENGFQRNSLSRSKEKTLRTVQDLIAERENPEQEKDNQPELPFR